MTATAQQILILVGLVLIGILLVVIRRQLATRRRLLQEAEARDAMANEQARERRASIEQSVRVIARALTQGQCELVEGCIRLKRLLDHLAPGLHEHETFGVFNEVYQKTCHIPILDDWKALKLRQRTAYLKEMALVEEVHKAEVLAAARGLDSYRFSS